MHRPGSKRPSSPFYDHPLYGHPWMSAEEAEARRRRRHRLWLSLLTERDWRRFGELADQVTDGFCPARLEDLDAPGLAVGVRWADARGGCSGERIGVMRDGYVAVVVWPKSRRVAARAARS